MNPDPDNVERLILLIIEKYGFHHVNSIQKAILLAENQLSKMVLNLKLGEGILENKNLQSALSAIINSGKRAFKGGIVIGNGDVFKDLVLPGLSRITLGEMLQSGFVSTVQNTVSENHCLCIGCNSTHENEVEVVSNSWQGGIVPYGYDDSLDNSGNFRLAGSLAGGMAVAYCFMHQTGLIRKLDKPLGLSLWRPDICWLDKCASGPDIAYLPNKYWLVGLGHLGQSYQWILSQLPKKLNDKIEVTLQDYDSIVRANYSAGLLSEKNFVGIKKARVSSQYLESHGINTRIIERAFDKSCIWSADDDPAIILCGVDSASARRNMDQKAFPLFIDSGLGGSLSTFDSMIIKNFRFKSDTTDFFHEDQVDSVHNRLNEIEEKQYKCGIISRKAISSSFIGLLNACIVFSEVIRAFNHGKSYESIDFSLREPNDLVAIFGTNSYDNDLLKYGFIEVPNL